MMTGQQAERRWVRLLGDSIRLARRLEKAARVRDSRQPIRTFLYQAMVFARRQAEAIQRLYPDAKSETMFLERNLFELWVNTRWILLREPNRRANRFIKFAAVQNLKALERCPEDLQPPGFDASLRRFRREQSRVRGLFLRLNGKGRPKWARTWALSGGQEFESIKSRVKEIAAADQQFKLDSQGRSWAYGIYSLLSESGHVSPLALRALVSFDRRRGWVPHHEPASQSLGSRVYVVGVLLELMKAFIREFKIAYEPERSRLMERFDEINLGRLAKRRKETVK